MKVKWWLYEYGRVEVLHIHFEWRARDVFVTPPDDDDVIPPLPHDVVHCEVVATHVFHIYLITRSLGSINSDKKNVVT